MKKRILSVIAATAVLAGSVCGISAADEEAKAIGLSPRAVIELADGEVSGITGPITADWLKAQFVGEVKILTHGGSELSGTELVPSLSTVASADGETAVAGVTIPGDADMNGQVDLSDAVAILKHIAKWKLENGEFDPASADIAGAEGVDLFDVTAILKYAAGWDVDIFDEAPVLSVFSAGVPNYKLLANDAETDAKIVSAVKALTGNDIEVVTEVSDGEHFITVGKDLYSKYPEIIDQAAVDALVGEDNGTMGYIDTYEGDIYLTAHTDYGILGCINYITNQAFSPELDMNIAKGTVGVLGDLETLVRPLYTTLEVEGLTTSHRLLQVTDSHITTIYDYEETPERRADSNNRLTAWIMNQYRKPSYLFLDEYFNYAQNIDAEGIMLTGDITDSPSQSNRDILEAAIDGCPIPSYYIYGNHDWTWNTNEAVGDIYQSGDYRLQYKSGFAQAVDAYDDDWNDYYNVIDKGEYVILSIDNSEYGFPSFRPAYNGVKSAIEDAKAAGKPVILMLHIPFHTDEMHESIDRIDGDGYCIKPEASQYNTWYYNLFTAEDSPVVAIFCGHVHETYETVIAGRIPQYLTAAALEGWCRVVDLVPASE